MLRVARDAAASRPSRDADIDRGRPAQSSVARQAALRVARDTSAARSAASAPIIAENDDRGRFCQSPAALKLHCARPRAWSPLARRATRISTEAVPPNRTRAGSGAARGASATCATAARRSLFAVCLSLDATKGRGRHARSAKSRKRHCMRRVRLSPIAHCCQGRKPSCPIFHAPIAAWRGWGAPSLAARSAVGGL